MWGGDKESTSTTFPRDNLSPMFLQLGTCWHLFQNGSLSVPMTNPMERPSQTGCIGVCEVVSVRDGTLVGTAGPYLPALRAHRGLILELTQRAVPGAGACLRNNLI